MTIMHVTVDLGDPTATLPLVVAYIPLNCNQTIRNLGRIMDAAGLERVSRISYVAIPEGTSVYVYGEVRELDIDLDEIPEAQRRK